MKFRKDLLRLYAVTSRAWARDDEDFFRQIEDAVRGGAGFVQLREKCMDTDALLPTAIRFQNLCRRLGAVCIINDDPLAALRCGADGVHVGQADFDVRQARGLLGPEKIIGVSAHNVQEALRAQEAGADYLGVGAAFATATKDNAMPVSRDTIRAVTEAVRIPVVAIGGIGPDNLPSLRGCGLDGVAVVSALFGQTNVRAAAESLRALAQSL